jgi:iron only hydrogenase large subunit-like protein
MEFSGAVRITDLNDFLNPSESCSVHTSMIKTSETNTAKVSLSDCLACSGCITSAETVLLEQHSSSSLIERLNKEHITISISQQSYLAIASHFNTTLEQIIPNVSKYLKSIGVNEVYDMCLSRDIVLESCYLEFKQRFSQAQVPIICSECPGWVCFALKKGDNNLLPLMSTVKTPMLVQRQAKNILGYHVAVMPCYDKKLEGVMETGVDLVLTTNELINLLGNLDILPDAQPFEFYSSTSVKTSSMGYAEYIFKRAVKEIYGLEPMIDFKNTRRRDILELEYQEIKFCIASGFQNIQNIIRDIKSKKCKYSYIEIMACPSGCLNGGGQPKMTRETVNRLETETSRFYQPMLQPCVDFETTRELKLLSTNTLRW